MKKTILTLFLTASFFLNALASDLPAHYREDGINWVPIPEDLSRYFAALQPGNIAIFPFKGFWYVAVFVSRESNGLGGHKNVVSDSTQLGEVVPGQPPPEVPPEILQKILEGSPNENPGGVDEEGPSETPTASENKEDPGVPSSGGQAAAAGALKAAFSMAVISRDKINNYLSAEEFLKYQTNLLKLAEKQFKSEFADEAIKVIKGLNLSLEELNSNFEFKLEHFDSFAILPPGEIQFLTSDPAFQKKALELYEKLYQHFPLSDQEQLAREIGLNSVIISDLAKSEGEGEVSDFHMEVAEGMADVLVGVDPYTGFARDVMEFVGGRNIITGEPLSGFERAVSGVFAAGSVVTFGGASSAKNIIKGLWKTQKNLSKSHRLKKIIQGTTEVSEAMLERLSGAFDRSLVKSKKAFKHLAKRLEGEHIIFEGKGGFSPEEMDEILSDYHKFGKNMEQIKGVEFKGRAWRTVTEKYGNEATGIGYNTEATVFMEHAGNVNSSHRYTMPGEGGVYSSIGKDVDAWQTAFEEVGAKADLPQILHHKDYELENVLDLTDTNNIKKLDVEVDDLAAESYLRTQTIGSVAREKGFQGIIFDSSKLKNGKNLVVFNKETK